MVVKKVLSSESLNEEKVVKKGIETTASFPAATGAVQSIVDHFYQHLRY